MGVPLKVDLLIEGGKVVLPSGLLEASIAIDEGVIVAIVRGSHAPQADRVVDAHGLLVLPGMVDMHVHFRDPGSPEREDFESGSRAAAAGGVTTVGEMPNTVPPVTSVEAFREKVKIGNSKSVVDFALIAGAGEVSAEALRGMAEEGAVAYKTFMTSRFRELYASDGQMLENFQVIAETGRPCLVHAEDGDIVERWRRRALEEGRRDPIAHAEYRPAIAEVEAAWRTIMLASEVGVHLHVCHISAGGVLDAIEWARSRGLRVSSETCPHYLFLTAEDMRRLGPYAKTDPPLRGPEDQRRLWEGLRRGVIDVVASDHAPYTEEEKERGWEDIFEAPSGGVGVETTLPLMLNSVKEGLLSLERLVEVFSQNPARLLGLYPRKGVIAVGSDGDLVLVDPKREFEIRGEELHSRQRRTSFEGYRGRGMPVKTILRGEIIVEEGKITVPSGYGEFLRPLSRL
jgi:allantoinase